MELEQAIRVIKSRREELTERGVGEVRIFGSTVREEVGEESDLDVIVELTRPMGLFGFIGIKLFLEESLGVEVDLVTKAGLHPALRRSILAEAVHAA
jgi:uncharacterized protein